MRGLYTGDSNYKEGIVDLSKAIELNPNYIEAYLTRGLSKAILGDYRGAIADFTKAIELNPNEGKTYHMRGNAKYFINEKNSACLDWSKAGELGYGEAYDNIKKLCN